jgi:N-acetylmuramoyl-L-alanine amidase
MKIRVKNKRRFSLWCIIFIVMLINLVFAAARRLEVDKPSGGNEKTAQSYVALAAGKDGSIVYTENNYFKRYVINCDSDTSKVRWEESKEYIDIILEKNSVAKLNIKGEEASAAKDIYYSNSSGKLIVRIKKAFNNNNFVRINSNKIIVLIAKAEKPFIRTIVLDAGHGGIDKGANYGNIYEKDITLKIANFAAEELMYNGFKVVKTRDEDAFLELREISNIANAASADLFISIHINDNEVSKYKGVTTYYYDLNGYQKNEREKLAKTVQKELASSDNWQDRGIAKENFAVLRNTNIPCVLLECGFMSNEEDRAKLMKDEVLKNLALNLSKGVSNYFLPE